MATIYYKNNKYSVFEIKHNNIKYPVILNYQDYQYIKHLNKSWLINEFGNIYCNHTIEHKIKEIYLHDIIMNLKNKENNIKNLNKPIIHVNRLGLDLRRENLLYDIINKETNKNMVKKKRNIDLPNIRSENIPTYIWYMKPDKTHGERFFIKIADVSWKTSSNKDLSLNYKLEEAKKFLRELKKDKPNLFDKYSMNGEFTKDGKIKLKEYFDIIEKAGINKFERLDKDNITDYYLKEDFSKLNNYEINLLNQLKFNF
jgi:hypothetical protein